VLEVDHLKELVLDLEDKTVFEVGSGGHLVRSR
jgi:hypothetical protein